MQRCLSTSDVPCGKLFDLSLKDSTETVARSIIVMCVCAQGTLCSLLIGECLAHCVDSEVLAGG